MGQTKISRMNYRDALNILGTRDSRKIANHTYLQRQPNGSIVVHLHSTDVVTYYPSGYIVLYTGGWETVTTKDRINSSLLDTRIYSIKGHWTITDSKGREYYYKESDVTLSDGTESYGVCITPTGDILNCQLVIASLIADVAGVECTNESCVKVLAGMALKEIKKLWRRALSRAWDHRSVVIEHCRYDLLPLFMGECTGCNKWESILKTRLAQGA